jgi:hypothetical protein
MTNLIMGVIILLLATSLMFINKLTPDTSSYMHFFSLIIQGFALGTIVSNFIPI